MLIALYGCGEKQSRSDGSDEPEITEAPEEEKSEPEPTLIPESSTAIGNTYVLKHRDSVRADFKSYKPEQRKIIAMLNRVDPGSALYRDSLLIPENLSEDPMVYTPFPLSVPEAEELTKFIIVSYPLQAFGAYEYGKLVRWGPTSMGGKATPTPTGLFFTNWRAKERISSENEEWLLKWYVNIHLGRGIAFHQYNLPGFPASHGCVRLYASDAQWLFDWAEPWKVTKEGEILRYGTPVIIEGGYGYGKPGIWRRMAEDPTVGVMGSDSLGALLTTYLAEIRSKKENPLVAQGQ